MILQKQSPRMDKEGGIPTYNEVLNKGVQLQVKPWYIFVLVAILTLIAIPSLSASNFVRVPLGKGASIEVPKNWTVYSGSQRVTLDAFVEAKGYRKTESELNFAANLYDERGKTMAFVNTRFYPNNPFSQAEARQLSSNDLREIDSEIKKNALATINTLGGRITKWFETMMYNFNNLFVLVHEHQLTYSDDNIKTRVRSLRVWNTPRSFTVTLSYRERDAKMLLPIIDYMTNSVRQE